MASLAGSHYHLRGHSLPIAVPQPLIVEDDVGDLVAPLLGDRRPSRELLRDLLMAGRGQRDNRPTGGDDCIPRMKNDERSGRGKREGAKARRRGCGFAKLCAAFYTDPYPVIILLSANSRA